MNLARTKDCAMYPKLSLSDVKLTQLLVRNEALISNSRPILRKVFNQLAVKEKFICLFDKHGYIIDIIAEIDTIQFLFENGMKLGTNLSMKSGGISAVGKVLKSGKMEVVNTVDHSLEALQKWTCIAAPVDSNHDLKGIVSIALKIDERINHCKIVIELISDYVTTLLNRDLKSQPNKLTFFGALILDNRNGLTPREIEVLYKLKLGEPISGLPGKMQLSTNTIKSHMKSIYRKLGVNSLETCLLAVDEIIEKACMI
ncbi:transcriptional regulator of acetoin/glycerol metabolism [Paenibacillus forsythiae]|uniref:Transcriptional regulator of acetoin/glycerol metabolism n=1 Tax=Paenibacillus forsythiae TaxID=365616 RepID=A0ABU3H4X3_9BACL|nr:helix-turn-helix transcriptional regulator [Paenibacillus forsythiae]MDT3425877.1 transcriptional regulator of acetoin/glycerol metabolism [Paenibacillus forsythiae]